MCHSLADHRQLMDHCTAKQGVCFKRIPTLPFNELGGSEDVF
jgi:hypothetical protein